MSAVMQVKLLRVLQERPLPPRRRPRGAQADIRIVARPIRI